MIYFLSLRFPQGKVTRLITRCFSVHVGKYPRFGHRHRESQEIPNGECVCVGGAVRGGGGLLESLRWFKVFAETEHCTVIIRF